MKKIYAQKEKICDALKLIAEIGKMGTETVKKSFFQLRPQGTELLRIFGTT